MKKLFTVFIVMALIAIGSNSLLAQVKVGEEVIQKFETPHPYQGKKGVVWEQKFHYPGAGYIAIHFASFELASGDFVEISSPEGDYLYKFKDKGKKHNNKNLSQFWATHIPGDTAIVRLIGKNKKKAKGFVIDKWVRGYDKHYISTLMSGMEEDRRSEMEALCSSDDKEWAKCYEGTTMYSEGRAVCRLLINGSSACTGWLLGSEGHVMTNNHCIGNSSDAANTDYEFMAEGATCGTSCASWFGCPGTVEASSATFIQTDSALDYTLVKLPTNVTGTYGYMQLRDTLPTVGERIYIPQHPSGYGKMFAVDSDVDGGFAKIYSTNETPCSGGPGDIGYYADTAGGSSGSPVLGYSDHLVVALHHCANCPNRGVPIPSIISDLGSNLPANAIGSTGPPDPPVANFTTSSTTVFEGGSVSFTDTSSNSPTSWSWTFSGGSPASSTSQNPTVTYNTAGSYTVSLIATNAGGSDTETKNNYITVTVVTPTVGNTDVFGSSSVSSNRRAMPFTMPENGTITSVSMYHVGGSGNMILGVYEGSGSPGNQLAVTASTAVSGSTGWQTINLTSGAFVSSGSTVWLAWVYESNPGIAYQTGSPGRVDAGEGWSGGMPDPYGSGTQANYLYSIYANYTPGGGSSTGTVGNTSVFSSTSTSDYRRAMPFTMPEGGTITSISMYHTGGSGNMILAVYDGSGTPQSRIGTTVSTAISGTTGWQTINLTTPVHVNNGETVWLAWVYSDNPGIRYQTGSPGRYQSTALWAGGMPDPFGSGSQSSYLYSIYATYTAD